MKKIAWVFATCAVMAALASCATSSAVLPSVQMTEIRDTVSELQTQQADSAAQMQNITDGVSAMHTYVDSFP
jgi:hypothetical protein